MEQPGSPTIPDAPPAAAAPDPACGRCGREIRGGRHSCIYCGGVAAGTEEPAAARPLVHGGRFRLGSTVWPFIVSFLLLTPMCWWFTNWALTRSPGGSDLWTSVTIAVVCFLAGPVAAVHQFGFVRRRVLEIHAERGLITPSGEAIPFSSVSAIDYRRGIFSGRAQPGDLAAGLPRGLFGYRLGPIVLPLLAIYFLLLPTLATFTPWHPRVVVDLVDGRRLSFRDPVHPAELIHEVRNGRC